MYVKLFSDLLQSSLWCEDAETRIVWITLLAMANEDGFVHAKAPGVAAMARISIEKTRSALEKFQAPDPESRTPDNEGRRIEAVEGGYDILNYPKYRGMKDREQQRAEWRRQKAAQRAQKRAAPNVHPDSPELSTPCPAMSTHTDTEAEADTEKENGSCTEVETAAASVPDILCGLELYEADAKLCQKLPAALPAWAKAFPGVDVGAEIAKAHAWEMANPKRRKKDRMRFLNNWLLRAQDKPRAGDGAALTGERMRELAAERRKKLGSALGEQVEQGNGPET